MRIKGVFSGIAALGRAIGTQSPAMDHKPLILKRGNAMRVIFFYPGEEGTYIDHAEVVLYQNGIVHIRSTQEEMTTHLQNCEILWNFETEAEERVSKVRLLKPKVESRSVEEEPPPPPKPTSPSSPLKS